jgi:hypothetical protein
MLKRATRKEKADMLTHVRIARARAREARSWEALTGKAARKLRAAADAAQVKVGEAAEAALKADRDAYAAEMVWEKAVWAKEKAEEVEELD